MIDKRLETELYAVRFEESMRFLRLFFVIGPALYLSFWCVDILYAPSLKFEFLFIRSLFVLATLLVFWNRHRIRSFNHSQIAQIVLTAIGSAGIDCMIFLTDGSSSVYTAGLNLVAVYSLIFAPFNTRQFFVAMALIYLPYYALSVVFWSSEVSPVHFLSYSFFNVGTAIGLSLIRHLKEKSRNDLIEAKLSLQEEVVNRELIIAIKAEEAVRLSRLSSQFSPQIVESIKSGVIDLDSTGHRTQICSIFIDIVNSTERVTRIDEASVDRVLAKFLEDSIKILLKYDITIDKFLGDGILGFSNAPLQRSDFAERAVHAALEVREKIKNDREFYEKNWQKEMEIRIGIAKGYANVGFYGSQRFYRSYTAIGPVVNLAARLCAAGTPGEIVIDHETQESIKDKFETVPLGKKTFKGFESDIIFTYKVSKSRSNHLITPGLSDCHQCGGILSLETNDQGQFIFMCRSCCMVIDSTQDSSEPSKKDKKPA